MHKHTLILSGFMAVLSVGCHKAIPIAAKAVPAAPVATSTPTPRPVASPARNVAATPTPARSAAPRPTAMTQQERETLNQRLAHLSDALFDYDTANIRSDAVSTLSADVSVVKGILANYPNQKLTVEGDADERGSAEYNLILGDKRAHAAEQFLANMGIPAAQMTIVSYGKERPVCETHDESCWQKNRRAHITAAP